MQAILLSAGIGSRLLPLTKIWPKCLMPINGIPLIEYWIQNLIKAGINEIFINTHHFSEEVIDFVKNNKNQKYITLFHEDELLGTAGTVNFILKQKKNIHKILLIHCDNYFNGNIEDFIRAHNIRPSEALMSLLCFTTDRPEKAGIIKIDKNSIVKEFYEKSEEFHGNLANGAIYILEQKILYWIKEHNPKDFSNEVIPNFINRIYAWHFKDFYIDIGDLNSLKKAQKINNNKIESQQTIDWINRFKESKILSLIEKL